MGCQQSKEDAVASGAASPPATNKPTAAVNKQQQHDASLSKGKPLMSKSDRDRTKKILDDQFKVDTQFVVHFAHVKSKMHQKLLQARENLSQQDATTNSSAAAAAAATKKSPRISFAVYAQEQHAKPSREERISQGIQLIYDRLHHLHLQQDVMKDDGNCQFRSLAHQLYGNADRFHASVRKRVLEYMQQHADTEFSFYFESTAEWNRYLQTMSNLGTWGDELTIKAASNAFYANVHVFTSEEENYYLCYTPDDHVVAQKMDEGKGQEPIDIFLAYISPIHYNSIELVKTKTK